MTQQTQQSKRVVYIVFTTDESGKVVVESRRTDLAAAQHDAQLIKSVSGRAAYVEKRDA